MAPQFSQKAWKPEYRWQWPLHPFIFLAAVILFETVTSTTLTAATKCQVTEPDGTSEGIANWEDTTLRNLRFTITVDRDLYNRGLVPSPVHEIGPYMKLSRMDLGKTNDQEAVKIEACLSQDIRESTLFKRAMMTSFGKARTKAHTQIMTFAAFPYKAEKQVIMSRTTQPKIGISVRKSARTIIGSVPEFQKSVLPDAQSINQSMAALSSTVKFPSPFGDPPLVEAHSNQSPLQLSGNESLLMNLTTAQAVNVSNCVIGCP